jgi:predicted DNA-binding transcriptional regulator AlpA
MHTDTPAAQALLIPGTEAARLAGISRSSWQRLRVRGQLPAAVRLGRAVRWRADEIRGWIAAGCPDGATWAATQAASGRRLRVS